MANSVDHAAELDEAAIAYCDLLGPRDICDQAERHHRHLIGSVNVTDAHNPVDRVLASLGGVEGNLEDEGVFVQRRGHHPLFERDAVIERRQLDHPVVVVFEDLVAVAGFEGCAHDGGLTDLGRDIADFADIGL